MSESVSERVRLTYGDATNLEIILIIVPFLWSPMFLCWLDGWSVGQNFINRAITLPSPILDLIFITKINIVQCCYNLIHQNTFQVFFSFFHVEYSKLNKTNSYTGCERIIASENLRHFLLLAWSRSCFLSFFLSLTFFLSRKLVFLLFLFL